MTMDLDWLEYIIHNEEGEIIGLSDECPEEAKKQYELWVEKNKKGIKM